MNIFRQYLPLCWFAENPMDLPESSRFFKQNLAFYFILELFIQVNMIDSFEAFVEVTLETLMTIGFVAIILALNKSTRLYIQIASAVLFCENIVAVFALPIIVWLTVTDDKISYFAIFMLGFWDFTLITFISRKVLSINTAAACIVSLTYFLATYGGAYGISTLISG